MIEIMQCPECEELVDKATVACPNLEADISKTTAHIGRDALKNSKHDPTEQEARRRSAEEKAEFDIKGTVLMKYTGNDTEVVIPSYVTEIGRSAFKDCSRIIGITIPDSVTEIGEQAFDGCSSLTSVTVPRNTTVSVDAFPRTCTVTRR